MELGSGDLVASVARNVSTPLDVPGNGRAVEETNGTPE
jgi:hypothetical protein